MKKMKVAINENLRRYILTERQTVSLAEADLTEVSAVVFDDKDAPKWIQAVRETGFNIPTFVVHSADHSLTDSVLGKVRGIFNYDLTNAALYGRQVDSIAQEYEDKLLPPFFGSLEKYVAQGYTQFDCPGHQGGEYYRRHPAGREFYDFFGENVFRSDLCNADVSMGDLLIHEGAPCEAQKAAAKAYNADKTYFVLNGTSASNKVVLNAVLAPGDLVLFDRNNHKSNHHGALIQAGATPVYLETARNPYGFIGGIDAHCFDEEYLRNLVKEVAPAKAKAKRPFRLAVIQLGTYDGTIYNARQVVDRIGHLCDYILFDSAWVGYEQFIPMMKDCSPMLLDLGPDDPGIFVTQSVHKQQAGFSQTSQIHKKDRHIKGQDRYVPHKRLNNAFMMHASTSPFYPLFAALDVNAKMNDGESGRAIWRDCVNVVIEARKLILRNCRYIRPFVPPVVDGVRWEDNDTQRIASDLRFFQFKPGEKWHAFEGYGENQYFVDPCKLLLTTPGINTATGEYEDFGVPATILANFLRQNSIVPEKCDLNSILFLMTPAENIAKMERLVNQLQRFEQMLDDNVPLRDVLPEIYKANEERYRGYTIRQLCQEMHDFYKSRNVKQLQKEMFRKAHFPKAVMLPQQAHFEFIRGNAELVPLEQARGRIAVEGALPYPPGVLCCVPGEVWGDAVLEYFLALEEGINRMPGFSPELQGVYVQQDRDGRKRAYGYVLTQKRAAELGLKI
jgi:ornithine decarboxylase